MSKSISPDPQTVMIGQGGDARCIAFNHLPPPNPQAPSLFWLSGFMSDMASTKAVALAEHAHDRGYGCTRFDYSGHGASGGAFTDSTIGRWLEEANCVFKQVTVGSQIIVGSSMGGHIALLLLRALRAASPNHAARVKGLVLIAPAWDMTEELMWNKFSDVARRDILEHGFHMRPSAYDSPYTITRDLIEDGRHHLLARAPFYPGCPVTILQGRQDRDVPAEHTRELMSFLHGDAIKLIEIADGEHRLSRPQDLQLLRTVVDELAAA